MALQYLMYAFNGFYVPFVLEVAFVNPEDWQLLASLDNDLGRCWQILAVVPVVSPFQERAETRGHQTLSGLIGSLRKLWSTHGNAPVFCFAFFPAVGKTVGIPGQKKGFYVLVLVGSEKQRQPKWISESLAARHRRLMVRPEFNL